MSKVLLDYAVSFTQVSGTNAASLAFLRNLAVITAPSEVAPAVTVTAATGDTVNPAILTLEGLFLAGTIVNAEFTSDVQPTPFEAPFTVPYDMTPDVLAEQWADLIKGIDQLTAVAVGNTIEIRAINGGQNVAVANPSVDDTGAAPLVTQIIEVTDPETLQYVSDKPEEIQGAFDGGLSRVYVILATDVTEIPAIIVDKECDFYTIASTTSFEEIEIVNALSKWQGVKAFTTISQTFGASQAAQDKQCVFFEDTSIATEKSAYFQIFSFGSLLASNSWRNQQYIPVNAANGNPVETLGKADSLFDDRLSFYLTDEEQGTRLAFFVAGGKSITEPYIEKEIQVVIQSTMLQFISGTQPMNIETNRRLLEQIGNEILQDYLNAGLLDPDGENTCTIRKSNESFIVNGQIITADAEALWRVELDALESVVI